MNYKKLFLLGIYGVGLIHIISASDSKQNNPKEKETTTEAKRLIRYSEVCVDLGKCQDLEEKQRLEQELSDLRKLLGFNK